MGRKRWLLGVVAALSVLAGCQLQPDVPSQKDIGFKRPERSDEVLTERTGTGPAAEDTTTARSARQRAAADQLATSRSQ